MGELRIKGLTEPQAWVLFGAKYSEGLHCLYVKPTDAYEERSCKALVRKGYLTFGGHNYGLTEKGLEARLDIVCQHQRQFPRQYAMEVSNAP